MRFDARACLCPPLVAGPVGPTTPPRPTARGVVINGRVDHRVALTMARLPGPDGKDEG